MMLSKGFIISLSTTIVLMIILLPIKTDMSYLFQISSFFIGILVYGLFVVILHKFINNGSFTSNLDYALNLLLPFAVLVKSGFLLLI